MQPEIQGLRRQRSQRSSGTGNGTGKEFDSNNDQNAQYTSLKDIIEHSPTKSSFCCDGNEFDSSNIAIRNELVKRAASVYLQSAVLLVTKDHNCFSAFWDKLKNRAASFCPFGGCLRSILRFFNNMFAHLRSLP